ncbi:hypothetical protein [Phenylobacterium sp.]|uniref:hypothetical protein n=1 Tax=Phenylobacterium sp. TaxID=1871053 RepID=UPI002F4050E4
MIAPVTTYGGVSLTQATQIGAAMTYAVSPSADAPSAEDQAQTGGDSGAEDKAAQLVASNVSLSPASMSALIAAQANLTQNAPAIIRRHTAETLGRMIWSLDQAPPLSPAPLAVRRLQAAQAALSNSLVDLTV